MSAKLKSLTVVVDRLVSRNNDLENRSHKNNFILYGFFEEADGVSGALLSNISQFFSRKLKMNCPQIERCHRLRRRHDDRSRPVIMKLIYIRAKIEVLENGFKLKGSDIRIAEDFPPHIHLVRKKMWDTSAPSWNMALASISVMTT